MQRRAPAVGQGGDNAAALPVVALAILAASTAVTIAVAAIAAVAVAEAFVAGALAFEIPESLITRCSSIPTWRVHPALPGGDRSTFA